MKKDEESALYPVRLLKAWVNFPRDTEPRQVLYIKTSTETLRLRGGKLVRLDPKLKMYLTKEDAEKQLKKVWVARRKFDMWMPEQAFCTGEERFFKDEQGTVFCGKGPYALEREALVASINLNMAAEAEVKKELENYRSLLARQHDKLAELESFVAPKKRSKKKGK